MSAPNIDALLETWAGSLPQDGGRAPFESHQHMYSLIDASVLGDVPWKCLMAGLPGRLDGNSPEWMRANYEVWYRDPDAVIATMLANPGFNGQFDARPYIDLDAHGRRRWSNVMSGNLAWKHSVSKYHFIGPMCQLTPNRMIYSRLMRRLKVPCTVR